MNDTCVGLKTKTEVVILIVVKIYQQPWLPITVHLLCARQVRDAGICLLIKQDATPDLSQSRPFLMNITWKEALSTDGTFTRTFLFLLLGLCPHDFPSLSKADEIQGERKNKSWKVILSLTSSS
jgi:hypothetical protein